MGQKWSARETAILIKRYNIASWTELRSLLPGRNKRSIEHKADREGLTRPEYSTKKGLYFNFARCSVHGMIRKDNIIWGGKHLNIPYCSIIVDRARSIQCKRRLTLLPRKSKLREKYRVT